LKAWNVTTGAQVLNLTPDHDPEMRFAFGCRAGDTSTLVLQTFTDRSELHLIAGDGTRGRMETPLTRGTNASCSGRHATRYISGRIDRRQRQTARCDIRPGDRRQLGQSMARNGGRGCCRLGFARARSPRQAACCLARRIRDARVQPRPQVDRQRGTRTSPVGSDGFRSEPDRSLVGATAP
jgi:hypothetical protein